MLALWILFGKKTKNSSPNMPTTYASTATCAGALPQMEFEKRKPSRLWKMLNCKKSYEDAVGRGSSPTENSRPALDFERADTPSLPAPSASEKQFAPIANSLLDPEAAPFIPKQPPARGSQTAYSPDDYFSCNPHPQTSNTGFESSSQPLAPGQQIPAGPSRPIGRIRRPLIPDRHRHSWVSKRSSFASSVELLGCVPEDEAHESATTAGAEISPATQHFVGQGFLADIERSTDQSGEAPPDLSDDAVSTVSETWSPALLDVFQYGYLKSLSGKQDTDSSSQYFGSILGPSGPHEYPSGPFEFGFCGMDEIPSGPFELSAEAEMFVPAAEASSSRAAPLDPTTVHYKNSIYCCADPIEHYFAMGEHPECLAVRVPYDAIASQVHETISMNMNLPVEDVNRTLHEGPLLVLNNAYWRRLIKKNEGSASDAEKIPAITQSYDTSGYKPYRQPLAQPNIYDVEDLTAFSSGYDGDIDTDSSSISSHSDEHAIHGEKFVCPDCGKDCTWNFGSDDELRPIVRKRSSNEADLEDEHVSKKVKTPEPRDAPDVAGYGELVDTPVYSPFPPDVPGLAPNSPGNPPLSSDLSPFFFRPKTYRYTPGEEDGESTYSTISEPPSPQAPTSPFYPERYPIHLPPSPFCCKYYNYNLDEEDGEPSSLDGDDLGESYIARANTSWYDDTTEDGSEEPAELEGDSAFPVDLAEVHIGMAQSSTLNEASGAHAQLDDGNDSEGMADAYIGTAKRANVVRAGTVKLVETGHDFVKQYYW